MLSNLSLKENTIKMNQSEGFTIYFHFKHDVYDTLTV